MLLLRGNTDLLRVVTGSAADIRPHISVVQIDAGTPPVVQPVPDFGALAAISTATTTTQVDATGLTAGHCYAVKDGSWYNAHASQSTPFKVEVFDGTRTSPKWNGTLLAGEMLVLDETGAWTLYDVNGLPKQFTTATTEAFLATAQSISAATYADLTGVTVTLDPGVWLITAHMYMSAANLAFLGHLSITDNANTVIVEGSQGAAASGTASVHQWACISLTAIVAPTATTTYKLRAARGLTTLTNSFTAQDGAGANVTNNASTATDKGTGMRAVRLR